MENRLEAGTYNSNTIASGATSDDEFLFFDLFSLMLHEKDANLHITNTHSDVTISNS